MPRRKSVPQGRTVSEVDDGLRRVYAEYKQQHAAKKAEIDRLSALILQSDNEMSAIGLRMEAVEDALGHKVYNGNL